MLIRPTAPQATFVAARVAAWIEIKEELEKFIEEYVAARVAAWIEIKEELEKFIEEYVAARVAAWIEIPVGVITAPCAVSRRPCGGVD